MPSNKQQIVFLTGGSSGIGLSTAELLMQKGHIVYSASRKGCQTKSDELTGGKIIGLSCDVCDEASLKSAVNRIINENGKIDVVICNAGNGIAGSIEDSSDSESRYQFDTNFFGLHNTIRAVLPYMRQQKKGKIIAVSSVAAIVPIPFQGLYSASKAAVLMMMQSLSMEVAPYGIKCSCILPGDTKTNFTSARKYVKSSLSDDNNYKTAMTKAVSQMERDEQNGMDPIQIAKAICKQVNKKKPSLIVIPGGFYKAVSIAVKIIPIRIKLGILQRMY